MTDASIANASASAARAESIPIDQIHVSKHELFETTEVLPLFARLQRHSRSGYKEMMVRIKPRHTH